MTTIYDLNEDCLIYIFKYLTIYELIEAEEVSEIFKNTCDVVYKSKWYHWINLDLRTMRPMIIADIFDRIGKSLKGFEFYGDYIMDRDLRMRIIVGLTNKCPKLQYLIINYVEFTVSYMQSLSSCFKHLRYLDLSLCRLDESTMAGILDGNKLRNLSTLKILGNPSIKGSFFINMKYLNSLDVSYCYDLQYNKFTKFLKKCIKLLELDISGCVELLDTGDIIQDLLTYQPHLEKLHFRFSGIPQNDKRYLMFKSMKNFNIDGDPI